MKIKTALYSILLLLCLIGLFSLYSYDQALEITFGRYIISTGSMLIFLVLLTIVFLLNLIINVLFLPSKIFQHIILKFKANQEKKHIQKLLQASRYILFKDQDKAYKIIRKILDDSANLPFEFDEYFRLLFINLDVGFNIKLHYLQKLLNTDSNFKFFVARDLSSAALRDQAYHYSLEFALLAFNINNKCPILLSLLIQIYATLEEWEKMQETIDLLQDSDQETFKLIKPTVAGYYLKAAKHFIGLGKEEESERYLKLCLQYQPESLKAIELIANIQSTSTLNLKEIIEQAFIISPSFDLFLIYYKHHKDYLVTQEIYNNLIGKIDKKQHLGLTISMAYFLNVKAELDRFVLPMI